MEIARIEKLTEKVRACLEKHPDTRDDDVLLTYRIIETYRPDDVRQIEVDGSPVVFIRARAVFAVREDQVKRIRAKIQNELGEFLPTNPEVRRKRKISEEAWQRWATGGRAPEEPWTNRD